MRRLLMPLVFCALACGCGKGKSSSSAESNGPARSMLTSPGAAPGVGFEGEIDAVVTGDKLRQGSVPLMLFVQGDRVRLDLPEILSKGLNLGASAYALIEPAAKKVTVVSDAQRQALVLDLTQAGAQFGGLNGAGAPASRGSASSGPAPSALRKTGAFDTVAGTKCENWDLLGGSHKATVCVADQAVPWLTMHPSGTSAESPWLAELFDGKHLPLRLVGYADDGATETSRIEVTRMVGKSVAASQFAYPSSYRVVDLARKAQTLAELRKRH